MNNKQMPEHAAKRLALLVADVLKGIRTAVDEGRPADRWLAQLFRQHSEFGSRDRRFLSQVIFSFFRWRGWLQHSRISSAERACIYAYALDSTSWHPAIIELSKQAKLDLDASEIQPIGDESVEVKAVSLGRWLGEDTPLSLELLVPEWVPSLVEEEVRSRLLESFQIRPPTWLRLVRGHEEQVLNELKQSHIEFWKHDRLERAIAILGAHPLKSLESAKHGYFEIQDLASQCVGLICDPKHRESWWDMCAGSGGKALHLADLLDNNGRILATDVRGSMIRNLKQRVRNSSFKCIRPRPLDEERGIKSELQFEGVLVDAPCSGIGTWSRNPDARWRLDEIRVGHYAETQIKLLNSAVPHILPGGVLVYAVCTVSEAETTEVIHTFLAQHPEFTMDPFIDPLSGKETNGPLRVWPWNGPCDGMFIAQLRRKG